MKTCVVPFPFLSNLRLKVWVFTDPAAYCDQRKKWGDHRESYSNAACFKGHTSNGERFEVDIIMFLDKRLRKHAVTTLIHESIHAVQFIGEEYAIKDREFDAYSASYIVEFARKKGMV